MNLLFVVPYVPNPIRVRPYALLRTLAGRGHRITLATLYQSVQEQADLAILADLGITIHASPLPKRRALWNSALAVPTRAPIQASYCWQPTLVRTLAQLLQTEPFDAIHVEHLRGARYGLFLREQLRNLPIHRGSDETHPNRPPIIWDSVDCISHLFAQAAQRSRSLSGRVMTKFELPRTQRYERWLLDQFERVLVTSVADQQAFLALAHGHRSATTDPRPQDNAPFVLPNGVDLTGCGRSPHQRTEEHDPAASDQIHTAPTVVFSGKMSYHANVSAALYLVQDIMPHVWARHPDVAVQIVGKDPPSQVRALATHTADSHGTEKRRVEVTGTVPDIRPYLQRATVAAAPLLYGAGIQNKILEAMACGTPVVTTGRATNGIRATADREFLVADTAEGFAEALCTLLRNPAQRAQVGQAGRAYVEREHSWDAIVTQLEAIYTNAGVA